MTYPYEARPDSTFAGQIAEAYLNQFDGLAASQIDHPGSDHCEGAGITLATLALEETTNRFDALVLDLSTKPEYQASALAHALDYAEPIAIEPLFQAIDTINPVSLNVDVRVKTVAAITAAMNRSVDPALPTMPWSTYKVGSDELLEEITNQPFIDPGTITEAFQAQPFTEFQDESRYQQHVTEVAIDFTQSPQAARRIFTGFGSVSAGELVVAGVLRGAHETGNETLLVQSATAFTNNPTYSSFVTGHLADLFREDEAVAVKIYDCIQENRDNLTGLDELEIERAKYMGRHGNTTEALAFAKELPNYEGRVWIMLHAAEGLAAKGEITQARAILAAAIELEPTDIEPYSEEETNLNVFEDMPDVDENDLESISVFNEESMVRSTFLEKSRHDLQIERGYTLEYVADRAAKIGAFDHAVWAYALSRKYPMQTEDFMAREAVSQFKINEYIRALLSNEHLNDIYITRPLKAALMAFAQRPTRFSTPLPDEEISSEVLRDVEEYTLALAQRHQSPLDEFFVRDAAGVLVALGKYDTAKELMQHITNNASRRELTADIIAHMAYTGQTSSALELYLSSPEPLSERLSKERALRSIIHNGMLLGDFDSVRTAVTELPDYSLRISIGSILSRESTDIGTMPDWLATQALGPESYGRSHDVKVIGQAILRAGIVKRQ